MNDRRLTILTTLAVVLTAGEFGSAIEIGLGKDPWGAGFAVIFGVFFGLATWLLRRGRVRAGAVFTALLCLFELLEYPGWHQHGAVQWATGTAFAVVSLAGLIAGAAVIVALAGAVAATTFDPAGSAVFAGTLSFGIAVSAVADPGSVPGAAYLAGLGPGLPCTRPPAERRRAAAGSRPGPAARRRAARAAAPRGPATGPGAPGAGARGGTAPPAAGPA